MKNKVWDKNYFFGIAILVIIIHGTMLFNKIAWHDEMGTMFLGWHTSLYHGRWFCHVLSTIFATVAGLEGVPLFHGAVVAICIACMALLIFDMFHIQKNGFKVSLALIFVAIPAVSGNLGYIGSSAQNFIGLLICVCAAYVLCKGINGKKNIWTFLLSVILLACSIGEYQCYITFYLTILLVYMTQTVVEERVTWKDFWIQAIYYVGAAVLGLIGYLVTNELILKITSIQLTDYANTDTYGLVSIEEYFERLQFVYEDFWTGGYPNSYTMFPFRWAEIYQILLVVLIALEVIVLLKKLLKKDIRGLLQLVLLGILVPLGLNFNFILYTDVHSLHMYQYVMFFVLMVVLCQGSVEHVNVYKKMLCTIVTCVVMFMGVLYARYDNVCYMYTLVRHDAAINYFTTLVTRIQSIEGYDDAYPVVYINPDNKSNIIDVVPYTYEAPLTNPYNSEIINAYTWRNMLQIKCGFAPAEMPESSYKNDPRVMEMPSYPDAGSIKIIDGVIVIKF